MASAGARSVRTRCFRIVFCMFFVSNNLDVVVFVMRLYIFVSNNQDVVVFGVFLHVVRVALSFPWARTSLV